MGVLNLNRACGADEQVKPATYSGGTWWFPPNGGPAGSSMACRVWLYFIVNKQQTNKFGTNEFVANEIIPTIQRILNFLKGFFWQKNAQLVNKR